MGNRAGSKLKVLLLVHPRLKPDRKTKHPSTEKSVYDAVLALGHGVEVATAEKDLVSLNRALGKFKPNVVFNLMEEFRGEGIFDFHLASYLEALGVAFTGCNPRGLALSRNKYLMMKAVRGLGFAVPQTELAVERGEQACPKGMGFPLFLKLNREHASLGITPKNRVATARQLASVCRRMRDDYHGRILIQEFIAGDDVTVSVWGNSRPEAFSPWRLKLGAADLFATEHLKFNPAYREKNSITTEKFRGSVAAKLEAAAIKIYSSLDLSGYGRMDFRVSPRGEFYLVDVNANPSLSPTEDFSESAAEKGYDYPQVIARILELALKYKPQL